MAKSAKKKKGKKKPIKFCFPFESNPSKRVKFNFNLAIYVAPKPLNDTVHLTVMAATTRGEDSMLLVKHSLSSLDDVRSFLTSPDFTALFAEIFKENCFNAIMKFWETIEIDSVKKKIKEVRSVHFKKPH